MKSEWFKDWFNTEEYLNVYKHHNEADAEDHIKLILDNVSIPGDAKILDMACGSGRHAILLARKKYNVTAVDLSENLLSIARQTSEVENLAINFIHSDIRNFNSIKKYDLILNLFTSFGYFQTDEENFSILKKAYDLLKVNGYFVLDYFNSKFLIDNLVEFSTEVIDGGIISQQRSIKDSRIVKKILIDKKDEHSEYEESVRMFSKDELTNELINIGFDIYRTFGDFFGNEFNPHSSPRLILICKK